MRDIFKKLRCRGGNDGTAKATGNACEESNEILEKPDKEINEENEEKETLLNGNEEVEEGEGKEAENCNEEKKEEILEEERNVEENKAEGEGAGNDISKDSEEVSEEEKGHLLANNEEEEEMKKSEKKPKKKEASKWMCGLGKKSGSDKEKKRKEDKHHPKKPASSEEENIAKECENEEDKAADNEAEGDPVDKTSTTEDDTHDAEEKSESEIKEFPENSVNGEDKVVVFVTESEAVVNEKQVETKEECFVSGDGLVKATKDKPATFEIHAPESSSFECRILDQNEKEVAIQIESIEENLQKATYCPSATGLHSIEAIWKGRHVMGSPFQLQVEEEQSD